MARPYRRLLLGGALALSVAAGLLVAGRQGHAADHLDPPARTDPAVDMIPDKAADITDIYAWHTAAFLIIALNFSGPQATTLPGAYDRDVLYTLNISNDNQPTTSEFPIEIRTFRGFELQDVYPTSEIYGRERCFLFAPFNDRLLNFTTEGVDEFNINRIAGLTIQYDRQLFISRVRVDFYSRGKMLFSISDDSWNIQVSPVDEHS